VGQFWSGALPAAIWGRMTFFGERAADLVRHSAEIPSLRMGPSRVHRTGVPFQLLNLICVFHRFIDQMVPVINMCLNSSE